MMNEIKYCKNIKIPEILIEIKNAVIKDKIIIFLKIISFLLR